MIYDDPSMLHAMKEIKKLQTDGERRKWLDNYFGLEDASQCTQDCLRCCDTGLTTIYHPSVVIATANGEAPEWHRTLMIRCNCAAGDKMPAQSPEQAARSEKNMGDKNYRHEKEPVYGDSVWHIAVNDPDGKAKCVDFEIRSLHEWKP